jgi:hypothetical protein
MESRNEQYIEQDRFDAEFSVFMRVKIVLVPSAVSGDLRDVGEGRECAVLAPFANSERAQVTSVRLISTLVSQRHYKQCCFHRPRWLCDDTHECRVR